MHYVKITPGSSPWLKPGVSTRKDSMRKLRPGGTQKSKSRRCWLEKSSLRELSCSAISGHMVIWTCPDGKTNDFIYVVAGLNPPQHFFCNENVILLY